MKTLTLTIPILLFAVTAFTQPDITFLLKAGDNVIDIEKSTGTPKYDNRTASTQTYLNNWNTFHYGAALQGIFKNGKKFNFGGEIAFHRLYYWEEAYYTSVSSSPYYRWGNVSTLGLGFLGQYNFNEKFYFKPGLGVQIYLDGSGTSFGLTEAFGMNNKISSDLYIPVEFRMDQISGNAVSFLFSLGVGLKKTF